MAGSVRLGDFVTQNCRNEIGLLDLPSLEASVVNPALATFRQKMSDGHHRYVVNHNALLDSERWNDLRQEIHDRDKGRCLICGAPGVDAHHWTYRYGFFCPWAITLVCRECHLTWQGEDPHHLPHDHPLRPQMFRVAEIARHLGR